MDMYHKRKIRQEKRNNNNDEKFIKAGINWYIPTLVTFNQPFCL